MKSASLLAGGKFWTALSLAAAAAGGATLAVVVPPAIEKIKLLTAGSDSLSPAQEQRIQQIVRDYLDKNPDVIEKGMQAAQARATADRTEKQKVAIHDRQKEIMESKEGTVIGNPSGDVTLVEFFDYNCGYCKSMFPSVMNTVNNDGHVRLVLKEFPILGPSSLTASKAALAARKQGKYSKLHLAMLGNKGPLTDDLIMKLAADAGLDVKRLQSDMQAPEITAIVDANRALARDLQITGTPAYIVADTLLPGAVDEQRLQALIAEGRNKPTVAR